MLNEASASACSTLRHYLIQMAVIHVVSKNPTPVESVQDVLDTELHSSAVAMYTLTSMVTSRSPIASVMNLTEH